MNPRSALRRTSAAASSGSRSHGSCIGIMRPGWVPHHSSSIQSFHARIAASPRSASFGASEIRCPTKPGRKDGKQTLAYTPLRSMSASRARMSHAPRRISSNRVGSKPYSVGGRPATALKPTFAISSPSQSHRWPPSSDSTTRGARSAYFAGNRPSHMCGGSTMWSSVEKIVRRALAGFRLGEERHPVATHPAAAEGVHVGELVDCDRHASVQDLGLVVQEGADRPVPERVERMRTERGAEVGAVLGAISRVGSPIVRASAVSRHMRSKVTERYVASSTDAPITMAPWLTRTTPSAVSDAIGEPVRRVRVEDLPLRTRPRARARRRTCTRPGA